MNRDRRETALNDVTRRILIRENYDQHFATLEERILVEDRLFLARWDALCRHNKVDSATLLPLIQPRWRNSSRGIDYTEIARGEYLTNEPARTGTTLILYRDSNGQTWVRMASELEDGRYERL